MIKEEPFDEAFQIAPANLEEDDEIIASYDIVLVNNSKFKCMSVAGLSNVLEHTSEYDVSLRTDSKEIKIATRLNDCLSVCYTKETNLTLSRKSYAVRLSRELNSAYFIPIASLHSISFLDEANKSNKVKDAQNLIYEDCFQMPNPTRNQHDQLCIEMKPLLYKRLRPVAHPDQAKQFLLELLTSGLNAKRHKFITDTNNSSSRQLPEGGSNVNKAAHLLNCPHWQMGRVNLYDIKQIEADELKTEALLRKGQVLTFSEMKEILDIEPYKLLSFLPTIALLILGNWVIKSNLLFKIDQFQDSEAKQSHYKDLIDARDYLLWILAERKNVTFAEIYPKFKKSPDHEEILNRLTIRKGLNEPLRFILPEDKEFLRMHSVASLQKNTLRLLEKHKSYLDT